MAVSFIHMDTPITPSLSPDFSGLGIAPALLDALKKLKFSQPTPIQQQAIPIGIQGKDVVGIAQTGTGKTLAFGIPMIQRLQLGTGPGGARQASIRGLIVLPTRELALQVDESLRRIGAGLGIRTAVLIGGAGMRPQIQAIGRDPHIIIATPGRLNDHLQQKTVKLDRTRIVVLDEADRMLDMGFAPQIARIFQHLPRERQTMLFSATMPPEIMKMATAEMKIPIRIEIARAGTTADLATQEIFIIAKDQKIRLTQSLLEKYLGPVLIFTRTKHGAKKLTHVIRDMGHPAAEIHSNRSLNQRREALDGFRSGKYRVLVATDIASRGIDVTGIELVLNFDLPEKTDDYVHRIGRTARAGMAGHAISLVAPDQRGELRDIERLIRKQLPISPLPILAGGQKLSSGIMSDRAPQYGKEEQGRGRSGSRDLRPPSGYAARRPNRRFRSRSR